MTRHPAQRGFTLLEMSILLVIIALLTGGILVGKNLIHAAQLRAVTGEVSRYKQAVVSFRDKYHALPGDFAGAVALWGAADGSAVTCQTTIGTGTQTCDGDGNGTITSPGNPHNYYESFRAWQHLANAGMIDGAYTGVTGAGGSFNSVLRVNVPRSRLKEGGYTLTTMLMGAYVQTLVFGAQTAADISNGSVLTPDEAYTIDAKIDDGIPDMGTVQATGTSCTVASVTVNTAYNSTIRDAACSLNFSLGF